MGNHSPIYESYRKWLDFALDDLSWTKANLYTLANKIVEFVKNKDLQ